MHYRTMKTIYIGTLAQQYFPQSKRHSAVTQLRRWVVRCKPLQLRLEELSFRKGQRMLTPLQHEAIIVFLGEPGE